MQQTRSKKLMVSLCGLALSSVFLINNKAVVHADTVDGSQNNAISWDSDSDASQVVSDTQTKTEQAMPQKADNSQQNATQPVQNSAEISTVRSSSAAPRTINQTAVVQSPHVANVQDAPKANPIVIYNPAGDKVNVHYVDANGNAVENSSHDYDIDVAKTGQGSYTVPNGYSLNNPDGKYNVNGGAFSAATLKGNLEHYDAVKKYGLGNVNLDTLSPAWNEYLSRDDVPVGKPYALYFAFGYHYSDYGGKASKDDIRSSMMSHSDGGNAGLGLAYIQNGEIQEAGNLLNINPRDDDGYSDTLQALQNYAYQHDKTTVYADDPESGGDGDAQIAAPLTLLTNTPAYDVQHLPVAFVESNSGGVVGMIQNYSGKVGTTQNVSLTVPTGYKLVDGASLPTSVTFANDTKPLLIKVEPNGQTNSAQNPANNQIHVQFRDQSTGAVIGEGEDIDLSSLHDGVHYYNVPAGFASDTKGIYSTRNGLFTDNYHMISGDTVTVPVHRTNRFTFSDNSGNVQSVNGNTINVILTKPSDVNPSKVDPNSPVYKITHSEAVRSIHVNFPDNQIPVSYKNIVDSSGNLVQTVHFTRDVTVDSLLDPSDSNYVLFEGAWKSDNQDHNFIGFEARTLPRIPGYTLSIKPA